MSELDQILALTMEELDQQQQKEADAEFRILVNLAKHYHSLKDVDRLSHAVCALISGPVATLSSFPVEE